MTILSSKGNGEKTLATERREKSWKRIMTSCVKNMNELREGIRTSKIIKTNGNKY